MFDGFRLLKILHIYDDVLISVFVKHRVLSSTVNKVVMIILSRIITCLSLSLLNYIYLQDTGKGMGLSV